jgi:hypothetical protein
MSTEKTVESKKEISFTKDAILSSTKYANRRDVLGVILEDDKSYTAEQIETLLAKFMKGKVK